MGSVVAPCLQSTGSRVVAQGLSWSTACGVFLDQESKPCMLHWQADSLLLSFQGSHLWELFSKNQIFVYIPNIKITWMILKLKKTNIKRNILNDPGKSLIFFLSPPKSGSTGCLPSADSWTRRRKKELKRIVVWGSDFEYPIQLSKYWLPITLSIVMGVGMLCIVMKQQLVSSIWLLIRS